MIGAAAREPHVVMGTSASPGEPGRAQPSRRGNPMEGPVDIKVKSKRQAELQWRNQSMTACCGVNDASSSSNAAPATVAEICQPANPHRGAGRL